MMLRRVIILLFFIIFSLPVFSIENPRWISNPIYVYIPQYGQMSVLMRQAFEAWENKSNKLVRFKFTTSPSNANIEVEFVDFVANCSDDGAVGCTELLTRSGRYNKAFITIGTKEYLRKYDGREYIRKIVPRSKEHIYGVMLHEAGHAIGLKHSEQKNSIMYPMDLNTMQYLTDEDMRLLYNKYH